MSALRNTIHVAIDTLDAVAGDLLALEAKVTHDPIDAEGCAELVKEIAMLQRAVMFVSEKLTDERRIGL